MIETSNISQREREVLYRLALTSIPGIGPVRARKLLSHLGSAAACFHPRNRAGLRGVYARIRECDQVELLRYAEAEIDHCKRSGIRILLESDADYPRRLSQCRDSPILLFQQGHSDLNTRRMLAIVGSRHATRYGKQVVFDWVNRLSRSSVTIVSGLALGVDGWSHEAALSNQMDTIAVLGHGLDHVYPAAHRGLKQRILKNNGSMLTEYRHDKLPHRMFFPARNRIVAGLVDAILVVESAQKGGALITAELGLSYDRQVFAVPGRVTDRFSAGCHQIVGNCTAALVTSPDDLLDEMDWLEETSQGVGMGRRETGILSEEQTRIMNYLEHRAAAASLQEIHVSTGRSHSKIIAELLQLELQGRVVALPGNQFVKA